MTQRSTVTNNNSIGIEICVNEDGNYTTARQNAIDLVKYLLQTNGYPGQPGDPAF